MSRSTSPTSPTGTTSWSWSVAPAHQATGRRASPPAWRGDHASGSMKSFDWVERSQEPNPIAARLPSDDSISSCAARFRSSIVRSRSSEAARNAALKTAFLIQTARQLPAAAKLVGVEASAARHRLGQQSLPDARAQRGRGHRESDAVGEAALQGRIEPLGQVRGEQDEPVEALDLGEQRVDRRVVVARGVARAALHEQRVGLVQKQHRALRSRRAKRARQILIRLADPLGRRARGSRRRRAGG